MKNKFDNLKFFSKINFKIIEKENIANFSNKYKKKYFTKFSKNNDRKEKCDKKQYKNVIF